MVAPPSRTRDADERSGGSRPIVAVQGLGFVGAAMAIAIARARRPDGTPRFDVVGIELPTPDGQAKVDALNAGRLPMAVSDVQLAEALAEAHSVGNLTATTDDSVLAGASVAVVDVPVDLISDRGVPAAEFSMLQAAARTLGRRMRPGSLVVVERSTWPP